MIGGVITEKPNLNPTEDRKFFVEYDLIQDYRSIFKTDKGELIIEFRNNSNGYYCGYLVFNDRKINIEDMSPITADI